MRTFVMLVCLAALVWTASAAPALASGSKDDSGKQVRVTADRLNIRSGPGTGNAVIASSAQGTILVELERDGDWVKVRTEDGTVGWAAARYLEPAKAAEPGASPGKAEPPPRSLTPPPSGEGGDRGDGGPGALRAVAKWGCLVGALAAGGLAFNERSSGNASYDDYKTLFRSEGATAAEPKYQETMDHDDKAQTYAIVAGVLCGLWALQQFVLGDGGGDAARADQSALRETEPGRMLLESGRGSIGARFVLARF